MADVILPNSTNISEIRDNYESIYKLYHFSQQSSSPLQNTLSFNSDISDIFEEAASILNGSHVGIELASEDLSSPIPFLNFAILQHERLSAELDRRLRLFDKSLLVSQQICDDQIDKLQFKCKSQLDDLKFKIRAEEKELNENLQDIQQSFETRLYVEVSKHVRERNIVESNLSKINSEYQLTETTLSTSLTASKMRSQLLEKQCGMLHDTSIQIATTISNQFEQKMNAIETKYTSQIKTAQDENLRLTTELNHAQDNFDIEMKRLQYELDHSDEIYENQINSLINQEMVQYEKKMRKITSKHDETISDLQHELDMEKLSSSNAIDLLTAELDLNQQLLNEANERYKSQLDDIEKKKQAQLNEIENDMKLLSNMQTRTLQQLADKHELNLEQDKHDQAKMRHNIDQKIAETQRDIEINRKQLESQITNLTRTKNKYEEEVKKMSMNITSSRVKDNDEEKQLSAIVPCMTLNVMVNVSIEPKTISTNPKIEETIQKHLSKASNILNHEMELFEKTKDSIQSQFENEKQLDLLEIEETQQKINILNAEKQTLQNDIQKMQNEINTSQSISIQQYEKSLINLRELAESQENIITNLREDLKNKRIDGVKKVDLSVITEENENEMKKLRSQYEKMKSDLSLKLHEVELNYENEISKEQSKTQNLIDGYRKRIQVIQEETDKTRKETESTFKDSYDALTNARKDIFDSKDKLGLKQLRPGSSLSRMPSSQINTPLPLLKQ